jgi:hypothetical protein
LREIVLARQLGELLVADGLADIDAAARDRLEKAR